MKNNHAIKPHERIRAILKARKLFASSLRGVWGKSVSGVCLKVNGQRKISFNDILAAAKFLNVSISLFEASDAEFERELAKLKPIPRVKCRVCKGRGFTLEAEPSRKSA